MKRISTHLMENKLWILNKYIFESAGHSLQVGAESGGWRGPTGTGRGSVNRHKSHQCQYCSYTTNFTTNLQNHERTHTGERPYSCSYCSLSFSQKGSLRSHILTHTGEKPFPCPYCTYRSSRKTTLRAHVCAHHSLMS